MIRTAIAAIALASGLAAAQPAGTVYVSAGLDSGTANFLDQDLNVISTFATPATPNGVGFDGTNIYVGSFSLGGWIIYDADGNFVQEVVAGTDNLQGLTILDGDVLVANSGTINRYDAVSGALLETVVPTISLFGVEGITTDGTNIYALDNAEIQIYSIASGSLVSTLPNPATDEAFGGTAITFVDGSLVVGGASGNWWRISAATGMISDSGTANTDLFGLTFIAPSGPCNAADVDGSGDLSFADVTAFINAFNQGCP